MTTKTLAWDLREFVEGLVLIVLSQKPRRSIATHVIYNCCRQHCARYRSPVTVDLPDVDWAISRLKVQGLVTEKYHDPGDCMTYKGRRQAKQGSHRRGRTDDLIGYATAVIREPHFRAEPDAPFSEALRVSVTCSYNERGTLKALRRFPAVTFGMRVGGAEFKDTQRDLAALERKGFVTRDKLTNTYELTENGRQIANALAETQS